LGEIREILQGANGLRYSRVPTADPLFAHHRMTSNFFWLSLLLTDLDTLGEVL
jgi:hypothetical protein